MAALFRVEAPVDASRMMARQGSGWYLGWGKRTLDVCAALLGLLLLSPVLLAVMLAVAIVLGPPVFFRQERPGYRGRRFTLLKFRTMTDVCDAEGVLLSDAKRLTRFGRFLRATSLDELPELINVLRGEMSLVGPRPLLLRYLPYFSTEERRRFEVRPGITGLAQVAGRNDLSWDLRIGRDVTYVERCSLGLDLKILFLTLWKVFLREGLRVDPASSMLDFDEERRRAGRLTGPGAP